jgi:hypothetical protein
LISPLGSAGGFQLTKTDSVDITKAFRAAGDSGTVMNKLIINEYYFC